MRKIVLGIIMLVICCVLTSCEESKIVLSSEANSLLVNEELELVTDSTDENITFEIVSGSEYATLDGNILKGVSKGEVIVVAKLNKTTSNELKITVIDNTDSYLAEIEEQVATIDNVLEVEDKTVKLFHSSENFLYKWNTSNDQIISKSGNVTHDKYLNQFVELTYEAYNKSDTATIYKTDKISLEVKCEEPDHIAAKTNEFLETAVLFRTLDNIAFNTFNNLVLVDSFKEELSQQTVEITWTSSDEKVINSQGEITTSTDGTVVMTSSFTVNGVDHTQDYKVNVIKREIKEIASTSDFMNIKNDLTAHYILKNDLDFTGIEFSQISGDFTGVLDGKGFKISSITTNSNGIFEKNSGIIRNIGFTNLVSNITSDESNNVGGLVVTNSGLIEEVYINAKLTICNKAKDLTVGGFAAIISNGVLINSYSDITINADLANNTGKTSIAAIASNLTNAFIDRSYTSTNITTTNASNKEVSASFAILNNNGGSMFRNMVVFGIINLNSNTETDSLHYAYAFTNENVDESNKYIDTFVLDENKYTATNIDQNFWGASPSTVSQSVWFNTKLDFSLDIWYLENVSYQHRPVLKFMH